MQSTTVILIALLTSTIAYPHRQHLLHHRRQDVVCVTDYNYVTETISITAAIWVQEEFVPPINSSLSSDEILTNCFQGTNTLVTSLVVPPTSSTYSLSAYDTRSPVGAGAEEVVAPGGCVRRSPGILQYLRPRESLDLDFQQDHCTVKQH
jgi:hypothetical protein